MAQAKKKLSTKAKRYAASQNKVGLDYYAQWEIDKAIDAFKEAATVDTENAEYHLNLARGYARGSKFHEAIAALGEYLRTETDDKVAERYERLFSSALDPVEDVLIKTMQGLDLPVQQVGKAIQMWLEYRITVGRKPLRIRKPELWAAGLTFAVSRVNFSTVTKVDIATAYGVSVRSMKDKYDGIVETLDLMPADYRYFAGDENPLDKLVEAAEMLDELYERFNED